MLDCDLVVAVGASLLPLVGGLINYFRVKNEYAGWYKSLKKPSWRPPNWMYAPIWVFLYLSMGCASYLVWRDAGKTISGVATLPLTLYATQLALNLAWPGVVMKGHNLQGGASLFLLMDANVAACAYTFHQVSPAAGFMMLPYLAWLVFSTAVSYRMAKDNPKHGETKKNK